MTWHLLLAPSRLQSRPCFALPTTSVDGDGRRRSNAWTTVPPARIGRIEGGTGIDRAENSERHARKRIRRTPPKAGGAVVEIGGVDGRFACAHADPSCMRFSTARCAYHGGGNAPRAPAPAKHPYVHCSRTDVQTQSIRTRPAGDSRPSSVASHRLFRGISRWLSHDAVDLAEFGIRQAPGRSAGICMNLFGPGRARDHGRHDRTRQQP